MKISLILSDLLSSVSPYTPDDVRDACNAYIASLRLGYSESKSEELRVTAVNRCDDSVKYWNVCPSGARSGNYMAVAAIRSVLINAGYHDMK